MGHDVVPNGRGKNIAHGKSLGETFADLGRGNIDPAMDELESPLLTQCKRTDVRGAVKDGKIDQIP